MILFTSHNIPKHLRDKIGLQYSIVDAERRVDASFTIVDCKATVGDIHHYTTQQLIDSYRADTSNIIYVFLITDDCEPFNVPPNVRVYRTSIIKSYGSYNEYVLPYIWVDKPTMFAPLTRTERPIIGFCGLLTPHRERILRLFAKDERFDARFIYKTMFWGGNPHDEAVIREFDENMKQSHFNMCSRGKGNFSMRLYETLASGRIPVFVNTDMILPLSTIIQWDDIAVIANTEEELIDKTLVFWYTRNIEDVQRRCGEIYQRHFKGTVYLDNILMHKWE